MKNRHTQARYRQLSLLVMVGFYLFAGINHFRDPDFYYPLIPDYLGFAYEINWLAGVFELAFAVALMFKPSRKAAAYALILMLLAFVPSHIYFIEVGGCMSDSLCVPAWVAWVRLIVIHPVLILWAWWHRK